ncbi:Ig-like domain-containing protein [Chryseolinea lacunae]|uniref:DUF4249 domain-containing protein n=1 Tax=Chryseolinea lacunae TaxID=2801331 RepID=A0ABS1L2I9_9BACT|nr:Ig-like domain-containing protein [Chryseolinea lacunae]MBL0745901.1 hypothetical protein [Chryseolinea lacunae]
MKTSKIFLNSEILFRILFAITVAILFAACDTLKQDPDVIDPVTEVKGTEIVVNGNTASIIDLNSKVQSNVPVTLTVTAQPTKGKLSSLGKGLLQYTPGNRKVKSRDAFEFTVFSSNNQILQRDTVIIIVEPDSTQLPCGIYAADDYVRGVEKGATVNINVLANDHICGFDTLDYEVSVYSAPHRGTATVVNNRIRYTAGPTYTDSDTLIYKVQPRQSAGQVSYAYVYIKASFAPEEPVPCQFTPFADTFNIKLDTLKGDTVLLRVFLNDQFCDSLRRAYTVHVTKAPAHGTTRILSSGIVYVPDQDLPVGSSRIDSLRYELCLVNTCRQAKVTVNVNH